MDNKKPTDRRLLNSPAGLRFLDEALKGKPSKEATEALRKTAAALEKRQSKPTTSDS